MNNLMRFFYLCCFLVLATNCLAAPRKCVILLHGLGRSHVCMAKLAKTLAEHDYIVINEDYPSTTKTIKELADSFLDPMIFACETYHATSIDFVTHSMGGIILQQYLQDNPIPKLRRIVMLSPPNHGSQVADILHNNWLFKYFTGPAGQELTTSKNSTPNLIKLKKVYEIGIIAGTFNFVPFGNLLFDAANDGAVSIESAKMNMMKDFITFPVSHPFIMDNALVQEQILYFLNNGRFNHSVLIPQARRATTAVQVMASLAARI